MYLQKMHALKMPMLCCTTNFTTRQCFDGPLDESQLKMIERMKRFATILKRVFAAESIYLIDKVRGEQMPLILRIWAGRASSGIHLIASACSKRIHTRN